MPKKGLKLSFNEGKDHALKYGLRIASRSLEGKVLEVNCRFCECFGREKRSNMKRAPRKTIAQFRNPFRTDAYARHLENEHASRWAVYKTLSVMEQKAYFTQLLSPELDLPEVVQTQVHEYQPLHGKNEWFQNLGHEMQKVGSENKPTQDAKVYQDLKRKLADIYPPSVDLPKVHSSSVTTPAKKPKANEQNLTPLKLSGMSFKALTEVMEMSPDEQALKEVLVAWYRAGYLTGKLLGAMKGKK